MSINKRLTEVFESAHEIPFDDSGKFVLFSDIHRGDNSWADDFAHNQTLFFHALNYYYNEGFTYIEVGDVDELWENRDFADIRRAHSHVFWLMRKFHTDQRFHLIWGNHDMERRDPNQVAKTLYRYYDDRSGEYKPLFEGIQVSEGITLRHADGDYSLFLVHGHQGDPINDRLWWFGRFFVRYFWRHLQLLGLRDPTSPAKNLEKRGKIEQKIIEWVKDKDQMTICGHTHRQAFAAPGEPPYFNTGSCIMPGVITGLEIQNGEIVPVKWSTRPGANGNGTARFERHLLAPSRKLHTLH